MANRKALKKEIKQLEKQLKLLKREYKDVKEKEKSAKSSVKKIATRFTKCTETNAQSNLNEQRIIPVPNQIPYSLQVSTPVIFRPFKNPPCKRCPALTNGICKCAMKRLQVAS
ncbi:hypothetical protein KP803_00580 [Vibrio sp. ZSDE26]|uniref:Uncharacterized protein n=1 Tax=Vibrio amylolyticus TaxID=2847292 RepID=A0A9X1XEZ5_9VIBR|nr:hypothetical protein [Vibrio amylolyticus]MCK6261762.1 hypothetical protein [Vibrio amylolyticus]